MSKNKSAQWVIKLESGTLLGPIGTAEVFRVIREGGISGLEKIQLHPGGEWRNISSEPEFYDQLMTVLEKATHRESKATQKIMQEDTIFMPPPMEEEVVKPVLQQTHAAVNVSDLFAKKEPEKPQIKFAKEKPKAEKFTTEDKEHIIEKIRIPLIFFGVAVVLAALYFSIEDNDSKTLDKGEKISLIGPTKTGATISAEQASAIFKGAVGDFQLDSFEGYKSAMMKLTNLAEGNPSNLEVRGLLCLTYNYLWPYSKQDANDQKVISTVTQSTRALNVGSQFGALCEVVKLITLGRYQEAKGAMDALLEIPEKFSLLGAAYVIKADLLELGKDVNNAIPYLEQATLLWPEWIRTHFRLGQLVAMNVDPVKGSEILRKVQEKNPKHKDSRVVIGILELQKFNQPESALKTFSGVWDSPGRILPAIELEGALNYIEVLNRKGDKVKALKMAERALAISPANDRARQWVISLGGKDNQSPTTKNNNELVFIGDQYLRQGDCLSAQAEYKAAFDLDPTNGTAAMKAAKCLWQLNRAYEAIDYLNKSIKNDPKLISSYVLLADYLSQRYDFMGASEIMQKASRIARNNSEVIKGMALLEFRKNNMKGAVGLAERAMKLVDTDIEAFIMLSKANLQLAQTMSTATKKDLEKRDEAVNFAYRYAVRAVELDSTNAEAQVTYAKMLAATTGIDSAVAYLKELIKKYSFSVDYKLALAEVYRHEDRFEQAKAIYEQVTELDPKNKKGWIGLGECYRFIGFTEKAMKAYLSAGLVDPTDAEPVFQVGRLLLEMKRLDEAIAQFKQVQQINPHFPKAYFYIAKGLFATRDFEGALKAIAEEKKRNPNIADTYMLAAEIFVAQKKFGECAGEYSIAVKLRPQGAEVYVKAAQCYRQSGAIDIAEDMLALASARESGYAEIYREQCAIFEIRGDARAAVKAYKTYLELAPNATDFSQISARVSALGG